MGGGSLVVDPWGDTKRGITARTRISRKDYGLTWNVGLEAGGVLVGALYRSRRKILVFLVAVLTIAVIFGAALYVIDPGGVGTTRAAAGAAGRLSASDQRVSRAAAASQGHVCSCRTTMPWPMKYADITAHVAVSIMKIEVMNRMAALPGA